MADVAISSPPSLPGVSGLGLSKHRFPPGIPEGACQALVEAFDNKDQEALSRLLADHPALSAVHLTRRSSPRGRRQLTLPLLHMAVRTNWIKGLDVLVQHEADFNQVDEQSGYTALGFAVSWASLPAMRRLLALGAPADDLAGSMPALAILPSVSAKSTSQQMALSAKVAQMMAELLAAGANPWALAGAEGDRVPIPQICLRWGRPELAAALLAVAPPPTPWQQNPVAVASFQQEWLVSVSRGSLDEHRALFDILASHRLLPPLDHLLMELPSAPHQPSVYSPSAPTARQILEDLVARGLAARIWGPLTAAHVEMTNQPGLEQIHACLLRDWLDQDTPETAMTLRKNQPRL